MVYIANPIYDIVFKYLLEDERVVKILLSALLKKTVVEVETRKHEYANVQRDKLSLFRIDFAAKVREQDGSLHLVLIELQKTWLETETLRFRQYLGAQYANPDNMLKEEKQDAHAIPMIAVYLLGHPVGDIEEPILYVKHQSYDYEGHVVTQGLPDPFVESLTHNSILVQIPRLHGQVNNRLEEILSVFDQTRQNKHNRQVMNLDESAYAHDEEMMAIIHRLIAAAADAEVRQKMNVEDEFFKAIEDRDTEIMKRNQLLAEKEKELNEKDQQLNKMDQQLNKMDQQLNKMDQQINEKDQQLNERNQQLNEQSQIILSAARQMKQAGIPIAQIAAITQLSPDELERL